MTAPLTQTEQAQLSIAFGRAMLRGHTAECHSIGENGLTVIANRFSAARWKQEFGDTFEGAPLRVFRTIDVEALTGVAL